MCGTREDAPTDYHYVHRVPNRDPCQTQGLPQAELGPGKFPTRRITTREALHKQNYDQGAYILPYPQAELLPGSWLAGWLAGWGDYIRPGNVSCAWLAGWLAGGLAGCGEALGFQWISVGPFAVHTGVCCGPRGAQRGGAWIEQACHALGWRLPASRITTREPTHKQNYDQGTGWLAGWLAEFRRGSLSCALLAGWLGGWLAG